MSDLEKTAPNEIYLIVGDIVEDCNFNELSEVTWADEPIYEQTAIKYVKASQLTIPKSIAEQADKTDLDTLFEWGQQEFYQWFNHEQDEFMPVIFAYLAGKALGVDLVKVVDA
jgi:hypothetical protein